MSKRALKIPRHPGPASAIARAVHTSAPRVAIVVSRYNATVTGSLLTGAIEAFKSVTGADHPEDDVFNAPGAFETVALSYAAAESRAFDGVVALGCIIKGETNHDEILGHAVTQALANITLITGVPVGLGVLTVNTGKQAKARSGGKHGNKGAEAMNAILATIAETARIAARRGGRATSGIGSTSFEIDLASLGMPHDKLDARRSRGTN